MAKRVIHILLVFTLLTGCEVTSVDPNAASEDEVLGSRSGLISAGIGLRAYYSKNSLLWVIENNALSSHEVSVTSSFQSARELEDGVSLTSFNSNIGNMWLSLLKVRFMADAILENLDDVVFTEEEERVIRGQALFYKAVAIGSLSQFFTHVPAPDDSESPFVDRNTALMESVSLLEEASGILEGGYAAELAEVVCGESFDLESSVNVYLSRYRLFLGDHEGVLSALETVDTETVSLFSFSSDTPNPIFGRVFGSNLYYQPRDAFGLVQPVDPNDQRLLFYLEGVAEISVSGIPVESLLGFFSQPEDGIPVYLPGEILLNRAEAFLEMGMLDESVDMINTVRQKQNDALGVVADLGAYDGGMEESSIREEIYHQRSIEMFMSGLRLEDSRRLGRSGPGEPGAERSRNFYPFPNVERINNPGTPDDPPN